MEKSYCVNRCWLLPWKAFVIEALTFEPIGRDVSPVKQLLPLEASLWKMLKSSRDQRSKRCCQKIASNYQLFYQQNTTTYGLEKQCFDHKTLLRSQWVSKLWTFYQQVINVLSASYQRESASYQRESASYQGESVSKLTRWVSQQVNKVSQSAS